MMAVVRAALAALLQADEAESVQHRSAEEPESALGLLEMAWELAANLAVSASESVPSLAAKASA